MCVFALQKAKVQVFLAKEMEKNFTKISQIWIDRWLREQSFNDMEVGLVLRSASVLVNSTFRGF